MTTSWLLLQSPAGAAAYNMALDETLWRTATARGQALLRIYSWNERAITFGYFQKFPAELADRYRCIRRPTGGGVVYHDADTTYTVVVPRGHALYELSTNDAYCTLHNAVAAAFAHRPQLHNTAVHSPRGQYECFQSPVAGDVVTDGRKLAGGAQRRGKAGMLHQGSILARLNAEQLVAGFRQVLHAEFQPYTLTDTEQAAADQLARDKYATDDWNKRIA
jgi:lipoyl(octanoyl) transferase